MDFDRQTVSHHEDVYVSYDVPKYKDIMKKRWNIWDNEPIENAGELCYCLRKAVNSDESRQVALMGIFEKHPRIIIFYNFDYELEILREIFLGRCDSQLADFEMAEWNGHCHQPIPDTKSWVYLVQYNAGAEGWNCIKTDTIVFYSQNYSYKIVTQASGRIDRLNTPYTDLYYYHLKSRAGIDLGISKALKEKKKFNEAGWLSKNGETRKSHMNITCEFCGSYIDTDSNGIRCPICRNAINFKTQVQKLKREMEEQEKMDKKEDSVTTNEELFLIPCRNSGRNIMKRMLNDLFGIGGDNMNTNYSNMYKNGSLFGMNGLRIKRVIFNEPATIVYWDDGEKTVVKCKEGERFDPEKGLAIAISKKALGNRGNYFNEFKKWLPEEIADTVSPNNS